MGTYITLQSSSQIAINEGFEIFKSLDNKLSTYKPSSEVSKYNKNPKSKLSDETKELISISENIKQITNGYFNINYQGKHYINFGGIAKGYAVDKVAKNWKQQGIKSGSISASGDVRCLDICDGFIEDPLHDGKYLLKFKAKKENLSITTSGNSRRPGHLINPKTTKSMYLFGSLTLFSYGDNTTIDALATAISVMPYEIALKYLTTLNNIAWVIVDSQNQIITSKNIDTFITY